MSLNRWRLSRSNSLGSSKRKGFFNEPDALRPVASNAQYDGLSVEKSNSEITALKIDNDLKKAQVVVVVMGPTGVGKSRFIKEATGQDVDVNDSLYSTESTVQPYHFMFRRKSFALVDTPGFDDTRRPDTLIFQELAAWLAARYQEKTRLTAIVYVQRISDTRVSGSILRNLMVMKRMIGVQNFKNIVLVTSMWDAVDTKTAESREQSLKADFWSDLIKSGAKIGRFRGDSKSAHNVLATISVLDELSLAIQHELVDERIPLERTTAGSFLDREIVTKSISKTEISSTALDRLGQRQDLKASWDPGYGSLWLEPASKPASGWDSKAYSKLEKEQFRLVELRAGSDEVPIEISVTTESFLHSPRYVALSYVVGRKQSLVEVNYRDDKTIYRREIPSNLFTALRHIRRPNTDVLIWVDQLSINQNDQQELAEQVRNMSRIFGGADNVCIWLGPRDDKNEKAMKLANKILDFDLLEELLNDPNMQPDFEHLATLMASPWFTRRWCVQEIVLAKSATLHAGDNVLRWADFADAATLLASRWESLRNRNGLLSQAELTPAIALIEASKEVVRRTDGGEIIEYQTNLEYLLWRLAIFDVTLLHDYIYAIYDLANDVRGKRFKIDYSMELRELFRDVTEMIVKSSGSLDIICRPWAPNTGLPSWIPTITRCPFAQRRGGYHFVRQNGDILVGSPGSRGYKACGNYTARASTAFRTDESQLVLTAQGISIGQISQTAGQCLRGIIPFQWMTLAGWKDACEDKAPDQFWRTLVADRSADGKKAPDWYRRACESSFSQSRTGDIDTEDLYHRTESPSVREFLTRVQSVIWSRSLAKLSTTTKETFGGFWKKFGSSQRAQLCLCPPESKEGDIIVVLCGCSVPVVMRPLPSYHVLIGECFVLGIMDGEAMMKSSQLGNTLEVYDIV